ncbi:MAG: hypothetical protein NC226_04755 [Bacteroides cellulosilyticus]|nr:hypothetical protein [Bacteroides cellulosilyticus]
MIKKLLGMLFAAAVLGTIVLTILGRGNYRSMIWDDEPGVSHLIRSVVPKVSKLRSSAAADAPAETAVPDAGAAAAETDADADASNITASHSSGSSAESSHSPASRAAAVASQRGQNASSGDRPLHRARKNADGEYEDYLDMPDSIECPDPLAELNR